MAMTMPGSVKSFCNVEDTHDSKKVAEMTAAASTLPELISTIPRSYQTLLGDYLNKKFRIAHKHANVQSTISSYERHEANKTIPPLVRDSVKDPKLHFSKEFLQTQNGSQCLEDFRAAMDAARLIVLNAAIKLKKGELQYLQTLILTEEDTWRQRCQTVARFIAEGNGGRMDMLNGKATFHGLPPIASNELALIQDAAAVYTYRCLELAQASIDRAKLWKLSKLKVKESTDVEMMDARKEQSVRDIIREEINSLKSELELSNKIIQAKGKNSTSRVQKAPLKGQKKAKISGNKKHSQKKISQ